MLLSKQKSQSSPVVNLTSAHVTSDSNVDGAASSEDESLVDSDEAAESEDYSEEEEDEEEGLSWDELEEEAKR